MYGPRIAASRKACLAESVVDDTKGDFPADFSLPQVGRALFWYTIYKPPKRSIEMKGNTLRAFLLALACTASAAWAVIPNTRARSVHLHHYPTPPATAIRGTVTVTETQTNSYYCIINCDRAYCGIQDLHGKRMFIFSVWEPGDDHDFKASAASVPEELRVKMLFAAEGTHVSRFGGEGTGARSLTDIAWKVGEPVSARIEIEPDGTDHTAFSCFVKQGEGDWKLLAKFSTLGPAKPFLGCASFVEDFWRTPESARLSRRAVFSGFAYRAADGGGWVPANSVRFTGDDLKADNVDAGKVSEGAFYLQTGGDTKNKGIPIGTVAE